jgi:RNA polymerase sigma-70 factor (ECF subfamily)
MMTGYISARESIIGSYETDLVVAAQKGDVEAFNQLVLSYQDKIFNLAARILGDSALADDISQNTFLTAYLSLPRFRNGSFRSWLFRIATNLCYDIHRQHKRHPVVSLENETESEERFLPLYDFPDPSGLPEKELEKREFEQHVQQALDQLDADHRTVVALIDLQDFDYKEAAQILDVPIGTVKSRLARGRQKLSHVLNAHDASSILYE